MTIIRVIDFETRGLPPDDCQIVEAATVDLIVDDDWRQIDRGRMWRTFIDPGKPIPPEVSAIHHITDDMVIGAPSIDNIRRYILVESMDGMGGPGYFAAHNSRFELACCAFLPPERMICTYKCAISAWPDAPSHGNQALRYWLKLKLADEAGPPHRALGDAYVTAAILRRLLIAGNKIEDMLAVSRLPAMLSKFRFGEHAMKPIRDVPTDYLCWIVEKSKGPWDEDVMHTAKTTLEQRRAEQRSRSPV